MANALHFRGNPRLRAQLEQALASGRLAGSYLFEGAPGAGQEQAAIELAAGVIVGDTDLANPDARRVRRYAHPDLHYVLPVIKPGSRPWGEMKVEEIFDLFRAEQARKAEDPYAQPDYAKKPHIPIEALRELLTLVFTKPFEGRGKAIIIRDADLIDAPAQDALLKTLEEPPPGRVIILISSRPEALRPTILSRCQRLPFDPLPRAEILAVLAERGLGGPRAELIATLADGSVDTAVQLAAAEAETPGEPNPLLARREAWLELLEVCELGSELEQLDALQDFVRGGGRENVTRERADFLALAVSWYHELLGQALGATAPRLYVDQRERLARQAGLGAVALVERIQRCERARAQILGYANAQLTLLSLFFTFRQGALARRAS
jgi:DNA polymerase-3 subunit delta'